MLQDHGNGKRVFLHAEPSNPYDKHAYRVLVWKNGALNHVGYVQRHFAEKISKVMQGPNGFDNKKTYLVGKLVNPSGRPDMFEVDINGAISDVQALIKRDEAVKSDTGIFGQPKKGFFDGIVKDSERDLAKAKADAAYRKRQSYIDHDEDEFRWGGIDEADLF